MLPGLLSANISYAEAVKNFNTTTIDWAKQDGYQKVLFEIELDQEARDTRLDSNIKVKSDCMKINSSVGFSSKEDQVMFVMPKFEMISCEDLGGVTVFKVK